jgi:dihydrofolate synthase/folylpolyglutamate synthase
VVQPLSHYSRSLAWLFERTTGSTRLGLERTEALLKAMGNPQDSLLAFHIAGTNGKGSVAAMLEAVLRAMGLRVGKYTSPHLVDFRERIVVDGQPIEENSVAAFLTQWMPAIEDTGATFFEATTALAFEEFCSSGVDVAVIETGLGGRLDATNVLRPITAIVTSIGMDHTEYLGDSIEQIAREKAGIFKEVTPAVIGERDATVRALLAEHARAAGASGICVVAEEMRTDNVSADSAGIHFDLKSPVLWGRIHAGVRGRHQVWNVCTTVSALRTAGPRFSPDLSLVNAALSHLSVPGRLQIIGDVIFDVAHNPAGVEVLVDALKDGFPGEVFTVLFCALADKDWRLMLRRLCPIAATIVLTNAATAPRSRTWDLQAAAAYCAMTGADCTVISDFDAALSYAQQGNRRLLITGSFHTVGDAMTRLQVSPLTR